MNHGRTPAMYTRELEARVAELEARNSELECWQAVVNAGNWCETTTIHKLNRQIKEQAERIAELEEANKLVIERRDEFYAENKKHIERVTQLEIENVALKLANKAEKSDRAWLSERAAELEAELDSITRDKDWRYYERKALELDGERMKLSERVTELQRNLSDVGRMHNEQAADAVRLAERTLQLEQVIERMKCCGALVCDVCRNDAESALTSKARQITKIDGATSNADAQSTPKVTTTSELTSKPEGSGSSCNLPPSTTTVQTAPHRESFEAGIRAALAEVPAAYTATTAAIERLLFQSAQGGSEK